MFLSVAQSHFDQHVLPIAFERREGGLIVNSPLTTKHKIDQPPPPLSSLPAIESPPPPSLRPAIEPPPHFFHSRLPHSTLLWQFFERCRAQSFVSHTLPQHPRRCPVWRCEPSRHRPPAARQSSRGSPARPRRTAERLPRPSRGPVRSPWRAAAWPPLRCW